MSKQVAFMYLGYTHTMLDAAAVLMDFRSPPGNRLEALEVNRNGQYSIRINAQSAPDTLID